MEVPENVVERIRNIPWFEACGSNTGATHSVRSWAKAIEVCSTDRWLRKTEGAAGDLTGRLSVNSSEEYQDWNHRVGAFKRQVLRPFVEPNIAAMTKAHELPPQFGDVVRWDVLFASMAEWYRPHLTGPVLFDDLLAEYEKGFFPCGWQGDWPDGAPIIF